MDTPLPATSSRRPATGFLLLVGLVVVGSVIVRLALLGQQSYWIDELFSASQSAGTVRTLLDVGSTEIHTPFYAGLLWAWSRLGGSHADWTRLLSTLFAVLAVVVSYRGLRSIRLDEHVRWALVAATAAGGTSIVYSLETRSYALLLLASVGLTATTLRAALLTLDREAVPGRTFLTWGGWVALAATTHLFGAILTLGAVVVLVVLTVGGAPGSRARRILIWPALAAAGCCLQVVWILRGLERPGFAAGTSWIKAPDRYDVWNLVTTTFSSGRLTPHKDGFAWASPIGVIAVVVLCAAAVLHGYRARATARTRARSEPEPAPAAAQPAEPPAAATAEAQAAAILLALAAIVIVVVFALSRSTHIWTLRNMVIVTPALTWGAICLAGAAAGTATARRLVATVVVVLLGVSLVPIANGLSQPYKTDFRGLLEYLISVRAQQPDAEFVILGRDAPGRWRDASERAADDPALPALYRDLVQYRRAGAYPGPAPNDPTPVTTVVTYYHGVANPHLDEQAAALVNRLGAGSCRRIPIYGVIVVRCN